MELNHLQPTIAVAGVAGIVVVAIAIRGDSIGCGSGSSLREDTVTAAVTGMVVVAAVAAPMYWEPVAWQAIVYIILFSTQFSKGRIIIPILQVKKLRLRKVTVCAADHTQLGKGKAWVQGVADPKAHIPNLCTKVP